MNNVFHAFLMMPLVTYAREPVPVHAPIISEEFKLSLQMYYSHYVMYKFSRINLVILTEMAKIRSHEKKFPLELFPGKKVPFCYIFDRRSSHKFGQNEPKLGFPFSFCTTFLESHN